MAASELSHAAARGTLFRTLKSVADVCSAALVAPLVLAYRLTVMFFPSRRQTAFQGYSQLMSLWPGASGNLLRRAFYRRTLARCSRNCHIGFGTLFATPEAEIGQHVYIGARCMIGHATIEDDVLIGSNVDILSGKNQHYFDRLDVPIRLQGGTFERVHIGRDAWIGNHACVATDVGAQAVVAVGAVVVKPVLPLTIVGGNPARVIARRSESGAMTVDAIPTAAASPQPVHHGSN
jgi:acetyltransferase-like isoleucine patch superfamily enzyme